MTDRADLDVEIENLKYRLKLSEDCECAKKICEIIVKEFKQNNREVNNSFEALLQWSKYIACVQAISGNYDVDDVYTEFVNEKKKWLTEQTILKLTEKYKTNECNFPLDNIINVAVVLGDDIEKNFRKILTILQTDKHHENFDQIEEVSGLLKTCEEQFSGLLSFLSEKCCSFVNQHVGEFHTEFSHISFPGSYYGNGFTDILIVDSEKGEIDLNTSSQLYFTLFKISETFVQEHFSWKFGNEASFLNHHFSNDCKNDDIFNPSFYAFNIEELKGVISHWFDDEKNVNPACMRPYLQIGEVGICDALNKHYDDQLVNNCDEIFKQSRVAAFHKAEHLLISNLYKMGISFIAVICFTNGLPFDQSNVYKMIKMLKSRNIICQNAEQNLLYLLSFTKIQSVVDHCYDIENGHVVKQLLPYQFLEMSGKNTIGHFCWILSVFEEHESPNDILKILKTFNKTSIHSTFPNQFMKERLLYYRHDISSDVRIILSDLENSKQLTNVCAMILRFIMTQWLVAICAFSEEILGFNVVLEIATQLHASQATTYEEYLKVVTKIIFSENKRLLVDLFACGNVAIKIYDIRCLIMDTENVG